AMVRMLVRNAHRLTHTFAQIAVALLIGAATVDILLVGVIDELPQSSARCTRFAFAGERIETPDAIVPKRISLGWFSQADCLRRLRSDGWTKSLRTGDGSHGQSRAMQGASRRVPCTDFRVMVEIPLLFGAYLEQVRDRDTERFAIWC